MSYFRLLPIIVFGLGLTAAGCGGKSRGATGAACRFDLDCEAPLYCFTQTMQCGPAKKLVILHTTDEHSHMLGFGPELDDYPAPTAAGTGTIKGGIGRRSALITQERAAATAKGADSILVSAGDNTMGTLIQVETPVTAPDFSMMKTLGYDVTTLGNHEFDFGPAALATALGYANDNGGLTPTVSTNIHFSATDAGDDGLAALYDSTGSDTTKPLHNTWIMTTTGGIKIGFIGIVGYGAAKDAPLKAPVTFSIPAGGTESDEISKVLPALYADLQPAVDSLRKVDKVDLVVALSHSGLDTITMTAGEDYQIAQNVSGIDVIVSGHTHLPVDAFTVTNLTSGKPVYIQQANCFGQHLGRMSLSFQGANLVMDTVNTALLPIDDTIVSDPALNPKIDAAIAGVETNPLLPTWLGHIVGTTVTDDTSKIGDLYFQTIGTTAFTVIGKKPVTDTPLMDLWADATLAATEAAVGPTTISIVAQGALRGDLNQGKTGNISFGDIFRAVPLGLSPSGTIGYPLCRTNIFAIEAKAAFEVTAGYAYTTSDSADYYLVGGGIKVEYDTSRPIFDSSSPGNLNNGRITKMNLASDHSKPDTFDEPFFDLSLGGFIGGHDASDLISITADSYVVQFAYVAGVTLKDANANPQMPGDTIIHRADNSEIKDWEAVGSYIRNQPGMAVPSSYMTGTHMACLPPVGTANSLCK